MDQAKNVDIGNKKITFTLIGNKYKILLKEKELNHSAKVKEE